MPNSSKLVRLNETHTTKPKLLSSREKNETKFLDEAYPGLP